MYDLQISSRIAFLLIFFFPLQKTTWSLELFSLIFGMFSWAEKKANLEPLIKWISQKKCMWGGEKTHVFNQPLFIWTTLLSGFFGIGSSQKTDYWSKSLVWRLLLSDRCIVLQIKPSTELQPSWERGPSFWNRECWCVLLLKFESLWDTDIISPR